MLKKKQLLSAGFKIKEHLKCSGYLVAITALKYPP